MTLLKRYLSAGSHKGQSNSRLMNERFNAYLEQDIILNVMLRHKLTTDDDIHNYILHNKVPEHITHLFLDKIQ